VRAPELPWYCWLLLDAAGIAALTVLVLAGKLQGREAAPWIGSIVVSGLAAQALQKRNPPGGPPSKRGKGGAPRLPPSGIVTLLGLLPFVLLLVTRQQSPRAS